MSQKEKYEKVVQEVEAEFISIGRKTPATLEEAMDEGLAVLELKEGLTLKAPTAYFANYKLRDALLLKSVESEEFSFILTNKIVGAVKSKAFEEGGKDLTQEDIEAMATVCHILSLWEQDNNASNIIGITEALIEAHDLDTPNLLTMSKQLLHSNINKQEARKGMVKNLKLQILTELEGEE